MVVMLSDNRRHFVELLAPAKNLNCGIAAVDSGADAVYIGGPSFSARVNAGNSIEDIASLCSYAHRFRAKVHVALNTILSDQEIREAEKLIWQLYDAGADALIIQDLGLLELDLPPVELHASTQQENSSPPKIRFLEEAGFSQVVLARELSIDQIREISSSADRIRLEFFVHGALCASVSGRCYVSQCVTGRSANRGECAQLCRVPMSLRTASGEYLARNRYLLSLRDLNHTSNLEELLDAGIRSFKIEGRLKDEGYVRNVTAWYRSQLDQIFERRQEYVRSSFGRTECSFVPDVSKSFNRGFTEYCLHGAHSNFANFDSPKFVGQQVAEVTGCRGNRITVRLMPESELHNGDKCNYFAGGELKGFRISTAKGNTLEIFQIPADLKPGVKLYRNKDAEFERDVSRNGASRRTLALYLEFTETLNGFVLSGRDETGAEATVELKETSLEKAKDPAGQLENIKTRLLRLGGTYFYPADLVMNCSYGWFIPVSRLNSLRHELLEKLVLQNDAPVRKPVLKPAGAGMHELPAEERRGGYQLNVYNSLSEKFYKEHGCSTPGTAYESEKRKKAVLMYCRQCLRYCFGMCEKYNLKRQPEPLELMIGTRVFRLEFDCRRCMMMVIDRD